MFGDLIIRLRSLLRGAAVEQELDDELRFHLEQQVNSYVRRGLSRGDAIRRARLEFGGLDQIKEAHRDVRGIGVLSHLGRDLRHAFRQFRRARGFTALAVLCLGLAIGVNTSIFGVLNSVLFRPMPVEQADRLIVISRGQAATFSYPTYRDFRDRTRTLSGLTASLPMESDLDIDGDSIFVAAEAVSGNYSQIIGARTVLGRWFTTDTEPVAVISYAVWQRSFNLSPDVLGRTVRSESQSYTVVGVAPREFNGIFSPLRTDIWVPIATRSAMAARLEDRSSRLLMLFGRLSDNATAAMVSSELNLIDAQLVSERVTQSVTAPIVADHVRGIANVTNRRSAQIVATFLTVVVSLVLLIACVNVGNLLLVRGAMRQREFALRRALGASRHRVLQQLLTESLMLAVAGGACGLLFARWSNALLERTLPLEQGFFPVQLNFDLDWRVITFATVVSLVTTILCGMLPAWRTSRTDGLVAFKGEIVGGVPRRRPLGLIAQVVMSFVLLLVAGTFVQALVRMQTADPGFAVAGRLYAFAFVSTPGVSPATSRQIYSRALEELRALPGVQTATQSYSLPFMPTASNCAARANGPRLSITTGAVDPGYFRTMDIGVLAGREFTSSDTPSDAPVVIVNEHLASGLWPNRSAIGEQVLIGCDAAKPATVVGVVSNSSVRSLGEPPHPHVYFPFAQNFSGGLTAILVETSTPPATLIEPVRRTLLAVGQGMRVYTVRPLSEHVEQSYSAIRWQTSILTSFGLLALVLAAVGLYGVIAYRVALRTREIGVRMALGAARRNVFREVVGQGLSIALIGVVIGGALMVMVGRLLGALDAAIQPPGLVVLGVTGLIWIVVAILATYVPAARASGVNPLIALRYE
ncbi:MAG TPA: ABC transporter permease [Vicinamibacterales bacterium]|nr:ABC transporter permease [Vicinamibacterales bacterium]